MVDGVMGSSILTPPMSCVNGGAHAAAASSTSSRSLAKQ